MAGINATLLVDQAYHAIKEDVLLKRIVPGRKINLPELSYRYGISATPIKLALNRLIIEGMVESIPHRGMLLKPISKKNLWETMEIRKMIELYAVPSVVSEAKSGSGFISSLRTNMENHERTIAKMGNTDFFLEQNSIDSEFHFLLVSTLNNERLVSIYRSLGSHLVMFYLYGIKRMKRFTESHDEHSAILRAIEQFDESALKTAIDTHLSNSYSDYLSTISTVIANAESTETAC